MQSDAAPFIPYAADIARCALMIAASGAADEVAAQIRQSNRGIPRGTPVDGMLTYIAATLCVYDVATAKKMREGLSHLLPREVVAWLGLLGSDGAPVSATQVSYFFRIFHRAYASDELRPSSARLSPEERQDHADQFDCLLNRVLIGWCPADIPFGDVLVFDTTSHQSYARPLPKRLRKTLLKERSTDLLTKAERRLPAEQQARLRRKREHLAVEARWGHATRTFAQAKSIIGGWHFHTVVSADMSDDEDAPPILQIAAAMTAASGYSAPRMLLKLLAVTTLRVGTTPLVVADRDYSKSLHLWQQLREDGRQFAFDMRAEQRGTRGAFKGAVLAQGNVLCPGTPPALLDPGARPLAVVRGEPNPAKKAWADVVRQQDAFRCIVRSRRPNGVNVSCPASGAYPRCQCELRGGLEPASPLPIVPNPPSREHPPAICTKQTVLVPDTANALRQTLPWGRRDWDKVYGRARAIVEGLHGQLKHPSGRHLTRWIAGCSYPEVIGMLVALDMGLLNVAKVRAWIARCPSHPVAKRLSRELLFASDDDVVEWLQTQITQHGNAA